ncbi:MAG: ABC transporter permease [Candidatus Kerfeldbacteria bacterium]|nr:ABC transporter permease [Candidatus Kerfeldbacteria bacterium]
MPTLLIALRNLFGERSRFVITVTGVTFSVVLIIILQALYQGWSFKTGQYIRAQDADLWVAQAGSRDMFHSISLLPASAASAIASLDGVAKVRPFVGKRVGLHIDDKDRVLYLVRDDGSSDRTGPVRLEQGGSPPRPGEIIVDRIFANNNGLVIGDSLEIGNQRFTIAGLASGGDLVTLSFAFINAEDADRMFQLPNLVNYFLVKLKPATDQPPIAGSITSLFDNATVFPKDEFVSINGEFIRESFLPIIFVLVLIGVAVGIVVIGLTIFTSTIDKSREFGVLKAIGASGTHLNRIVAIQSLVASLFGYTAGTIVAILLGLVVGRYVPEFVVLFRPIDFAWIFAVAVAMALLAALIPIRRIASINPADVFKA